MGQGEPVPVELAAAIGQVREQLAKAIEEGRARLWRFAQVRSNRSSK